MRRENHPRTSPIAELTILALVLTAFLVPVHHQVQAAASANTAQVHRTFWLTGRIIPSASWNDSLPGPSITVDSGDLVTLMLNSGDNIQHQWFIDSDNNTVLDSSELFRSPFFETSAYVNYTFTPVVGVNVTSPGTFEYRCYFHAMMAGRITINPAPDYSLSNNGPLTITPASAGTVTITATLTSGTPQSVTLSCPNYFLPAGITCGSFTVNPLTPTTTGATTVLTVNVASSVTGGSYSFQVTGSTQGVTTTTTVVNIVVTLPSLPDFQIAANLSSETVVAGLKANSTITVTPSNGFSGNITLTSSASPTAGLTCVLSPTMLTEGSGTATLSCYGSSGEYTVTVKASNGTLSHSTRTDITVQDYTIASASSNITTSAEVAGTTTITIQPYYGFSNFVNLFSTVSPNGLGCTLTPTSLASGSGASRLSCKGSPGTYSVTITATSGSLSHSTQLTVSIAAASPPQPASTILGLNPQVFYAIIGVLIGAVVAISSALLVRQRRKG